MRKKLHHFLEGSKMMLFLRNKNFPIYFLAYREVRLWEDSKEVLNHDAALLCVEGEFSSEIGMCDCNKLACTGTERFAPHMSNAIFGDNIVNVILAGGNDCTGLKDGLDSADSTFFCGGRKGYKALAAL